MSEPLSLADVGNRFLVGARGAKVLSIQLPARLGAMSREDALNLIAWLAVIGDIPRDDIERACRQVEST